MSCSLWNWLISFQTAIWPKKNESLLCRYVFKNKNQRSCTNRLCSMYDKWVMFKIKINNNNNNNKIKYIVFVLWAWINLILSCIFFSFREYHMYRNRLTRRHENYSYLKMPDVFSMWYIFIIEYELIVLVIR